MTPEERKRERILLKKYGRTIAEVETMLVSQGGGCAVCGKTKKEGTYKVKKGKHAGTERNRPSLSVDHDHAFSTQKVWAVGVKGNWKAWANAGPEYTATGRTKSIAIKAVKALLVRGSVRGILCFHCNTALRKFSDKPELLRNAADYLERFTNG